MMSVKDPGAGRESGIHDQEVVADTHGLITGDHSLKNGEFASEIIIEYSIPAF